MAEVRTGLGNFFRDYAISHRIEFRHLLWVFALTPFFIAPPLFSLAYCVWLLTRHKERANAQIEWIALISALNLILSVLVLHSLGGAFLDLVPQTAFGMLNWLRSVLGHPIMPDSGLSA